jgi:L-ascorbate metabolism protein UlaG (beta-lactamase superfamily)
VQSRSFRHWLLLLGLGWAFAGTAMAQAPAAAPAPAAGGVDLFYLGNCGFLLRSGGKAVLIDAFVQKPYGGYAALPPGILDRMLAGDPPFDAVVVALTSHYHQDHFQAGPAGAFLRQHPGVPLVSSPQVVDSLIDGNVAPDVPMERLISVLPAEGEVISREENGVRIDFLRLSHGSKRYRTIQNLAHIIHLGGMKILHTGDVEMVAAHFTPYDFPGRKIDVAIVPYWYFLVEPGRKIVRDQIGAAHVVADHIPPTDLEKVTAQLAERAPDVVIFKKPMEKRHFAAAAAGPS